MPASAPSVETIAALVRLGGGALDLWMLLHATAGEDGISYLTNGSIAEMTGRTSRWIQLASQRLRDAGFLIGGSGMWKVLVPGVNAQVKNFADAKIPSPQCEETFADANETSHDEPVAPPPTPPTRTRESAYVVVLDVNENENDVVDGKGGVGEKPGKRRSVVPDSFQPDETRIALAAELGISGRLERERQAFIDHSQAKRAVYADHQRAFANWLRKSREFHGPERNGHGPWQAWETVLSVLDFTARNGRRPDEKPNDPALMQAVAVLGGWDALEGSDFQRAHFIRAYQEFSKGAA